MVLFSILYNGPQSAAQEYTAPFHALGPLSVSNGTSNLPGLSAVTGNDENSQICQNGFNRLKFPLNLQQYSIAAQRTTFNAFNNLTSQAAFNQSLLIFEAYSSQAVKAVRADSTAFAQRNDNIIVLASSLSHDCLCCTDKLLDLLSCHTCQTPPSIQLQLLLAKTSGKHSTPRVEARSSMLMSIMPMATRQNSSSMATNRGGFQS